MTPANLGENALLHLLTSRWKTRRPVRVGVGDDCAVLETTSPKIQTLFKTDAVVESVHFTTKTPATLVGRKAIARAVSDIAAMGGKPVAALVTVGLPRDYSVKRLTAVYRGMERAAREYGVNLAGGETTRARDFFLIIALLGEVRGHAPVLRSTAKPGDLLWVTGVLGGTQKKHHLTFTPRLAEGAWLAKHGFATAMMDISDGLGADLPRLAGASRLAFGILENAVPRRPGASLNAAFNDGEDFELLFTTHAKQGARLKKLWPFKTRLTCIGTALHKQKKRSTALPPSGYDHFLNG